MIQVPVYVSKSGKVFKANAPVSPQRNTGWLGPVGNIVETEYDGVVSRYYSPDRSSGLTQPPRDWVTAQGCE